MTDDYSTRDAAEVRGRIADILGYCNLDGGLHNPEHFDKKFLRSKWVCPDCSTVAGKVAYKRAQELQWMLVPPEGPGTETEQQPTREQVEAGEDEEDEPEETADEPADGDEDDDETVGDTDSSDVKARIENAQADIEEIEEAAEQ